MTDDLVKRLRERGGRTPTAAADRIEVLERNLKTVLDREAATYERHDAKSEKLEQEHVLDAKLLADTQALLDKAVGALRTLLATAHADDHAGWHDALKEAAAALAEIERGKTND